MKTWTHRSDKSLKVFCRILSKSEMAKGSLRALRATIKFDPLSG